MGLIYSSIDLMHALNTISTILDLEVFMHSYLYNASVQCKATYTIHNEIENLSREVWIKETRNSIQADQIFYKNLLLAFLLD